MKITSPRIMAAGFLVSVGSLTALCSDWGLAILLGGLMLIVGGAITGLIEAAIGGSESNRSLRVILGIVGLVAAPVIALFVLAAGSVGACEA